MSDYVVLILGIMVAAWWILFPWLALFSTLSRRTFISGGVVCALAGSFFALAGETVGVLATFSPIGVFYCSWRFKIPGVFLSQLVFGLLMLAYDIYYYSVVFPPINPEPTNDTQCGIAILTFILSQAYFLLCLVLFKGALFLRKKFSSRRSESF